MTTATKDITRVEIPDNRNPSICMRCTSVCCKNAPGIVWPMDLATDSAGLIAAVTEKLGTGRYALDWWEGDIKPGGRMSRVMYLRPAVVGKEGRIEDPSWGGTCTFLTPGGCALSWNERPTGCKALVPSLADDCGDTVIDGVNYTSKEDAVLAWRPYQRELRAALAAAHSE